MSGEAGRSPLDNLHAFVSKARSGRITNNSSKYTNMEPRVGRGVRSSASLLPGWPPFSWYLGGIFDSVGSETFADGLLNL